MNHKGYVIEQVIVGDKKNRRKAEDLLKKFVITPVTGSSIERSVGVNSRHLTQREIVFESLWYSEASWTDFHCHVAKIMMIIIFLAR